MTEGEVFVGIIRLEPFTWINAIAFDEVNHQTYLENGTWDQAAYLTTWFANDLNYTIKNFQATSSSTWYIYFVNSLQYETTYVAQFAIDRTPPIVQSIDFDKDLPLHGVVDMAIRIEDDYLPASGVRIYVDGHLVETIAQYPDEYRIGLITSFRFETYNWINGNHTIALEAYDTRGRTSDLYQLQIVIENYFWDIPSNLVYIIAGYMGLFFIGFILKPTLVVSARVLTRFEFKLKWNAIVMTLGVMFICFGFVASYLISSDLIRGLLHVTGFSLIGLSGILYALFLIRKAIAQPRVHYTGGTQSAQRTGDENNTSEIMIEYGFFHSRSDALDKTRGHMRSGISIVTGIGVIILGWLLDYGSEHQLSVTEVLLLIGGVALVTSHLIAIVQSFVREDLSVSGIVLTEGLIPNTNDHALYLEQLKREIAQKERSHRNMRRSVAFGIVVFVVATCLGLLLPIYLAATMSLEYFPILLLSAIPLGLIAIASALLASVLLHPILLPGVVEKLHAQQEISG